MVLIRWIDSELDIRAITITVTAILLYKCYLVSNKDNKCLLNVRADVCECRSEIIQDDPAV